MEDHKPQIPSESESPLAQQYLSERFEYHHKEIDREVAEAEPCDKCGLTEMKYIGLKRFNGERMIYVSIAHCKNCGYEYEF